MAEASHILSCHCQKHVFRFTPPAEPLKGSVCDCSHCLKKRLIWIKSPAGSVELVRGGDMGTYQFGTKYIQHQYCQDCGTQLLGMKYDPKADFYMINARAFRDQAFEHWKLPLSLINGHTVGEAYTPPTLASLPGAQEYLERRAKDYDYPTDISVGSCHCQAIKFAVVHKPLDQVHLCDCDCSICLGNGALWIYPGRRNTFFEPNAGADTPYTPKDGVLFEYGFLKRENLHSSCKICGCHIFEYGRQQDGTENGWNGGYGLNIALLNREHLERVDIPEILWINAVDDKGEVREKGEKYKGLDRVTGLHTDYNVKL